MQVPPSSIQQQCVDLNQTILNVLNKNVEVKQLYEYLPVLMDKIFGEKGWLDDVKDQRDLIYISDLLGPQSNMMRFIIAYSSDEMTHYNFPVASLPYRTTLLIMAEVPLPSLYSQKMKNSIVQNNRSNVTISIFEFYMFLFARYATTERRALFRSGTGEKPVDVYQHLLREYLQFFLPVETIPSSHASPKSVNATLGHKLIQILVEFWWCRNITDKVRLQFQQPYIRNKLQGADLHIQTYALPSALSLKYSTMMVKHVLCYLHNSNSYAVNTSYSPNSLRKSTENTDRPVLLQLIQEPLYDFLKLAFTSWPNTQQILPQPLYRVIRLWLAYIAPWSYASSYKPIKPLFKSQNERYFTPGTANISSKVKEPYNDKWKSHVFNNFLFYTHLLPLFLVCSNRVLRFSANLQDVLELEKVAKTYKEDRLISVVHETDHLASLGNQQLNTQPISREQNELLQKLKPHIQLLESVSFSYMPLGGNEHQIPDYVRDIIAKLQEAARNGSLVHNPPSAVTSERSQESIEKRIAPNIILALGAIFRIPNAVQLAQDIQRAPAGAMVPRNVASVEDTLPEIDKDSLRLTQKGREQLRKGERKASLLVPTPYLGDTTSRPVQSTEIGILVKYLHLLSQQLSKNPRVRKFWGDVQYAVHLGKIPRQEADVSLRWLAYKPLYVWALTFYILYVIYKWIASLF